MELTKENIYQVFIDRGATKEEADRAAMYADRFQDFYEAENPEAIKNLFDFLGNNILEKKTVYWLKANNRMQTKPMLVACLFDLGIFALDQDDAEALGLDEDIVVSVDEPEAIKIDLNKILGIDVEAMLHHQTTKNVLEMVRGNEAALARKSNLNITTVTWEDTSRNHNSCWGSNISDMTLGVEIKDEVTGEKDTKILPVIRANNFEDRSADVDPEKFMINVGNATGDELKKISLKEVLQKPWELLTDPEEWPLKDEDGNPKGLFAEGVDKKALVSAQACMLPVTRKGGEAVYKPYIYNYQSWYSNEHGPQPYVLTIMVTRHGASVAVCGQKRDGSRGQPIWFNDKGEKAPLVAKRPTKQEAKEIQQHKEEGRTAQDNSDQHNRVLIIQVPLTPGHKKQTYRSSVNIGNSLVDNMFDKVDVFDSWKEYANDLLGESVKGISSGASMSLSVTPIAESVASEVFSRPVRRRYKQRQRGTSDLETAVIHTGETDGDFNHDLSKDWTRDVSSPIRITVQLAKATSNGVVTAEQMEELAKELDEVYLDASRIGSLVIPN